MFTLETGAEPILVSRLTIHYILRLMTLASNSKSKYIVYITITITNVSNDSITIPKQWMCVNVLFVCSVRVKMVICYRPDLHMEWNSNTDNWLRGIYRPWKCILHRSPLLAFSYCLSSSYIRINFQSWNTSSGMYI